MPRPRSQDARDRALDAALDILEESGVEGLTVEAVTAASGVAKSTLYRHFGSREELLAEAVRTCIVEVPTPDTGSLVDDLETLFFSYDAEDKERLNNLTPLLLDAARRDASLHPIVQQLIAERQRPLRTVMKLAQLRGEVDPDLDLDVAVSLVIGPLNYRITVQGGEIDDDFVHLVLPAAAAALRAAAPAARATDDDVRC